ncbi:MAG: C_GCAxxG_C_C family protein [Lachnospiraceae bacterium]|nr:C_GCAxxG_C_C family protein [Lachnospiraceae bacterium]
MNRKEQAIAYHDRKFNCAQAVACAFHKELGVDEEILFKACEGLGLGMGGMCATCGAVSGAVMAAGFLNSDGNLEDPKTKADTYKLSKEIVNRFIEKNGSSVCKELKGVETGKVLRSCPDCIMDAVEIAEDVLGIK